MNFGAFLVLGIGALLLIVGLRGSYGNIWQSFGGGPVPNASIGGFSSGNWPGTGGTVGGEAPPIGGTNPLPVKPVPSITAQGLSNHRIL